MTEVEIGAAPDPKTAAVDDLLVWLRAHGVEEVYLANDPAMACLEWLVAEGCDIKIVAFENGARVDVYLSGETFQRIGEAFSSTLQGAIIRATAVTVGAATGQEDRDG